MIEEDLEAAGRVAQEPGKDGLCATAGLGGHRLLQLFLHHGEGVLEGAGVVGLVTGCFDVALSGHSERREQLGGSISRLKMARLSSRILSFSCNEL